MIGPGKRRRFSLKNDQKVMKKIILLFTILPFLFHCGTRQGEVERIMEDGVEVVVNHLEPYKIKGEPSVLHLDREFTIDTERDEIAEIGVTDIGSFDVDSEGSIYFFQERENVENLVYKFDNQGNFVTSFGKWGQGPGEIQYPYYLSVTKKNHIPIQDGNRPILFIFDENGDLIKKIKFNMLDSGGLGDFTFLPLENSNYLANGVKLDLSTNHRLDLLYLVDSKFEKLKELDKCDYGPIFRVAPKKEGTPRVFVSNVSKGMIYTGNENRGYEILVYDLDGNILKKIRKEYNPSDVPEEFKENWRVNSGPYKNKLYFADKMPPFHYFFLDDEGRLYVKTYEKGNKQGEYIHDIFNPDGIFIGRKSMAAYGNNIYPGMALNRAKAKNNRFYCIREKENGYKELVVYRMTWE